MFCQSLHLLHRNYTERSVSSAIYLVRVSLRSIYEYMFVVSHNSDTWYTVRDMILVTRTVRLPRHFTTFIIRSMVSLSFRLLNLYTILKIERWFTNVSLKLEMKSCGPQPHWCCKNCSCHVNPKQKTWSQVYFLLHYTISMLQRVGIYSIYMVGFE